MALTLESTVERYEMKDASGYGYTIIARKDPEWGWQADVTMTTSGAKTSEAAVAHLRASAEHFLRQLTAEGGRAVTEKVWDVAKLREHALKTAVRGECRIDVELLVGVIDQLEAEKTELRSKLNESMDGYDVMRESLAAERDAARAALAAASNPLPGPADTAPTTAQRCGGTGAVPSKTFHMGYPPDDDCLGCPDCRPGAPTTASPPVLGCEHGRLPGQPCPHCLGINTPLMR